MKRIFSIAFVMIMAMTAFAQTSLNQGILFPKDSTNVQESQIARLELVVEYIRKHPKETVIIGGFTSTRTPAANIQKICDQRAEAVRNYIVEKYRIPMNRLISLGVGVSTKYVDPSFNEVVEFFIR